VLRPLVTGEIKQWAGFTFIMIGDRDENGLSLSANLRKNVAYHKEAIGLAVGVEMSTKIDWVPIKTSWLINNMFSAGSVLIDAKGLVDIDSFEA